MVFGGCFGVCTFGDSFVKDGTEYVSIAKPIYNENGEVDEFTKFFYGQYGEYVGSENYNSDWLLEDKETCTIID